MSKVSFDGIGEVVATFYAGEAVEPGQAVKLDGDSTVEGCEDGDAFFGVALSNERGCAGVQVRGFMTLPYSGTAPEVGAAVLAADGQGGVKTAGSGTACTVVSVDAAAERAVIFM